MVTCFNTFLFHFLMDILKFWIISKCSGKNFVILRVSSECSLLCMNAWIGTSFVIISFILHSIQSLLVTQCSCLLHLCCVSNFNLACCSYFLLHLTYCIIFIDASQESCYSTVVTEHYFNLLKYYLFKHYQYCYPSIFKRELVECMYSLPLFSYHTINHILYKQCMKVEQTMLTTFQNTFPLLKPNLRLLLQPSWPCFHPYPYIIISLIIFTFIIITPF